MNEFDEEPTTATVLLGRAHHAKAPIASNDRFCVGPFERPNYKVLHQTHGGSEGVVWRACYRSRLPWPLELAIKQLFAQPTPLFFGLSSFRISSGRASTQ